MSRTQKKALIASGSLHLLLLIILIVAPAFLIKKEEPVDQTVLTLVNTEISDQPPSQPILSTPEPTPPVENPEPTPPPVARPEPTPKPEPVVKPPEPRPEPKKPIEKKPAPVVPKKQETKPIKVEPPKRSKAVPVKISTKIITDSTATKKAQAERDRKAAAEQREKREAAFASAKPNLADKFKPGLNFTATTTGTTGVTYNEYDAHVRAVYMRHWHPPSGISTSSATVTVKVIIKKDGSVKFARITGRSGNSKLDSNITDLIKKITNVNKTFPSGAKETERTYIIDFNLDLKLNG